jgi:hypothetical protein
LTGRAAVTAGERCGHDGSRQRVTGLRERHGEPLRREGVDLGGTTSARAGASAETFVAEIEHLSLDQAVQVKGCKLHGDAHSLGGLCAAHRLVLGSDIPVKLEARRFCQQRHSGQLIFAVHTPLPLPSGYRQ